MRIGIFVVFLFFSLFQVHAQNASRGTSVAYVKLFPAGSFELKSIIQGEWPLAEKKGLRSKKLVAPIESMRTGNKLRDSHLPKYIKSVVVSDIQVQSPQKGSAKMSVNGVQKDIDFTYKNIGKGLAEARFSIKLKDFGITGINYLGVGVQDQVDVVATVPVEGS